VAEETPCKLVVLSRMPALRPSDLLVVEVFRSDRLHSATGEDTVAFLFRKKQQVHYVEIVMARVPSGECSALAAVTSALRLPSERRHLQGAHCSHLVSFVYSCATNEAAHQTSFIVPQFLAPKRFWSVEAMHRTGVVFAAATAQIFADDAPSFKGPQLCCPQIVSRFLFR